MALYCCVREQVSSKGLRLEGNMAVNGREVADGAAGIRKAYVRQVAAAPRARGSHRASPAAEKLSRHGRAHAFGGRRGRRPRFPPRR